MTILGIYAPVCKKDDIRVPVLGCIGNVLKKKQQCNGNNILHELLKSASIEDLMTFVGMLNKDILADLLMTVNNIGVKPSESLPSDDKKQNYLSWVEAHKDWYLLHMPLTALVIYSKDDREGAEDEADRIVRCLKNIGLVVKKKLVSNRNQFRERITKILKNNPMMSGFVLVVMSHGEAGKIRLSEESDGSFDIKDIFSILDAKKELKHKPKVS